MFASLMAAQGRLRAFAVLSIAAVLAAFALVAGPLATPSRAVVDGEAGSLEEFLEEIAAASIATEPYTITLTDDIVFTGSDPAVEFLPSVDVTIIGNGNDGENSNPDGLPHTVLCGDESCDGWLMVNATADDAVLTISDVTISGFRHAVNVEDTHVEISRTTFVANGRTTDADIGMGGAALHVANYEGWKNTTLTDVDFIDNELVGLRGAVWAAGADLSGTVTIAGGSFVNNTLALTSDNPDDVAAVNAAALGLWGASFFIDGTVFEGNAAYGPFDAEDFTGRIQGGAIGVYESEGEIVNASFEDNASDGLAGAVYIEDSSLFVADSRFSANAAQFGGALYANDAYLGLDGVTVEDNTAASAGGGAFVYLAQLNAEWSEFKNNSAPGGHGGAIELYGWDGCEDACDEPVTSRIRWSLFHGNEAARGGAVDANTVWLQVGATTFTDNSAERGAAVLVEDSDATLFNVTVARNSSSDDDGGQVQAAGDGLVHLIATAVVEPTLGYNCQPGHDDGEIHSDGFTIADDDTCSLGEIGDDRIDPGAALLGPLQFNGGPTWTMVPAPESPLVDAIPMELCDGDTPFDLTDSLDQRSVEIGQWAGCDIGAVEIFRPLEDDFVTPGGTVHVRVLNVQDVEGGVADLALVTPAPPAGIAFPYQGFELEMEVWAAGWPADLQYFTPAPTNQMWKLFDDEWVQVPGATATSIYGGTLWNFRIIDGGFGDNDFDADSFIVDPFAAGVGASFTG